MGILNSEMKYQEVINDLDNCCLTEQHCGSCDMDGCIIGYAKKCAMACREEGVTYVDEGSEKIPFDTKIYDEEAAVAGIAHILKQCKSCDTSHFDNCIINIIRNCYEISLFGEVQGYKGSAFQYLNQIHNLKPEIAKLIIDTFHGDR